MVIELTVKLLSGQNHQFTVPSHFTVEQLKEHIAETIQLPSDSQRCIYLGQVLQNDTKLADCNVHGKVIHVVHRPPPSLSNESPNTNSNGNGSNNAGTLPGRRFEAHTTGTMYLGAMAFPSDFNMDTGGLTFLHPRTNLSVSRLVVARNLLRRAINIINQLESENYFSSNQEQGSQSQSRAASNNLGEDIINPVNGSGLEQADVEIRIELPNSHHDPVSETVVGPDDVAEIPDPTLPNGSTSTEPLSGGGTANESTSNGQTEGESAAGGSNRDDANRRRSSRTPMMATVMGAVLHAQVRLIPFMRLLRQYLLQDTAFGSDMPTTHTEQQVQSLYNSVSELMHYFAHIYHSLSDIMCDFSQPPPRTLRCRPVILQQQHAAVLRSGPRGRSTIIRSPVLAVSRSTSTTPGETEAAGNATAGPPEIGISINNELNGDAGAPTVEVVIEEADTTNMHDGLPESMDTGEPIVTAAEDENGPNNAAGTGEPSVTSRGGSTYVIQSMPEGILPEGIRINSMEATILTPGDNLTAALASGANQRWRAGILPADVLQNMFGFLNQFRQTTRPQQQSTPGAGAGAAGAGANAATATTATTPATPAAGDRPRQPSSNNASDNNQPSQPTNNSTNGETPPSQSQSNSNERSFEFDITGLSRTFDPFLPCHSHHVHPVVSRASGLRNAANARNTNTQSSSSGQSSQPHQNSQTASQEQRQGPQEAQAQQSTAENHSQAQHPGRRNDEEGAFGIPEMSRNVTNLFSNIFPGFSIGNVMIRRGSADANNSPTEGDNNNQGRQSARARIQLTSNLNAMFPGAIQIEIDPLTNNIQTNILPNGNAQQTDSDNRPRRTRTASRRMRRTPGNSNSAANDGQLPRSSSTSSASSSSTSPYSPESSISSSDVDDTNTVSVNKEEKEKACPNRTIRHLFSMVKKENTRFLTGKSSTNGKREIPNNYPLYVENQDGSFSDVINAVINNTSLNEIIRGSEINISQLTSSIRQKMRSYLTERRNLLNGDKNGLLNVVNALINNNLYRMKNLLDSDCVKQEIDLVSTICKFNQDSVPELIEYVLKAQDLNDNDLRKFCKRFHFYIARLLTLFVHCISGDDKSPYIKKVLEAVIEEIVKSLSKDEELVRWLRKDLINHVISYSKICQPDNLPAFMRHYVVYRLPPAVPVECTVATATITSIRENDIAPVQQSQPMEVEDAVQSSSSSSSESSFLSAHSDVARTMTEQTANTPATSSSSRPAVIPIVPAAGSLPEVVLNSEEWHQSIPTEWVPLITRDIHRLRRQGSQPPFSDAYLSGMPTKRRKLVKKSKPDLQESSQLITDNISTAINGAGFSASVNSITNHVVEGNASEGTLSEIVKEELKENVRENMVQQSDFLPHRFPDSSKYFMDK